MNITFKPNLGMPIVNIDNPLNAKAGGQVPFYDGETDKQKHQDTLRANLESGELVIPLRHVKMVEKWLSDKGIYDLVKGKFTK
jgi:hypothetical protein